MLQKLIVTVVGLIAMISAVHADVITFGNTLFIGDSITEGASYRPAGDGDRSWRYSLWKNMVDNGDTFQFVGSRTSNFAGPTTYPSYSGATFENRHEAFWGTTSFERATTLTGQYGDLNADGSNLVADTAFIFLGSNDVSNPGNALTSIRDQFQTIVDGLQNANANVNIYLISVLPRFMIDTNGDGFADSPYERNFAYTELNGLLADLAIAETNPTSRVGFIDVASQMTPLFYYDGLHPNGVGEDIVGDFVYNSVASSMASVPEPSALLFLMVVGGGVCFSMCRRRLTKPSCSVS